jgi:hypothetical protein
LGGYSRHGYRFVEVCHGDGCCSAGVGSCSGCGDCSCSRGSNMHSVVVAGMVVVSHSVDVVIVVIVSDSVVVAVKVRASDSVVETVIVAVEAEGGNSLSM